MNAEYADLDREIWKFQERQELTSEEEANRAEVIGRLQQTLYRVCPGAVLKPFGSQATGLQTKSSDIDLGFVLPGQMQQHFQQQQPQLQREMIQRVLLNMVNELNRNEWVTTPVLQATVPLVKCVDPQSGLHCDICHLEPNALINADYIRKYTQIDFRVRPLLLAVKVWAKQRGINEASQGTLNSFGYCLMTIQYLQCCTPPVLPALNAHTKVLPPRRLSQEHFQHTLEFWETSSRPASRNPSLAPSAEHNKSSSTTNENEAESASNHAESAESASPPTTSTTSTTTATSTPPTPITPASTRSAPPASGDDVKAADSDVAANGDHSRLTILSLASQHAGGGAGKAVAAAATTTGTTGTHMRSESDPEGSQGSMGPPRPRTTTSTRPTPVLVQKVKATKAEGRRARSATMPVSGQSGQLEEEHNMASVAELLLGFFNFYCNFDIDVDCVDTSTGRLIKKRSVVPAVRRSALCVLDPSNRENNVARSVRRWEWQSMHKEFQRGRQQVAEKHSMGLTCFEELTLQVDTSGHQEYRRVWQKTQLLAKIRTEMEENRQRLQRRLRDHPEQLQQERQHYQKQIQSALEGLWRMGLRPRSMHSHNSPQSFTPGHFTASSTPHGPSPHSPFLTTSPPMIYSPSPYSPNRTPYPRALSPHRPRADADFQAQTHAAPSPTERDAAVPSGRTSSTTGSEEASRSSSPPPSPTKDPSAPSPSFPAMAYPTLPASPHMHTTQQPSNRARTQSYPVNLQNPHAAPFDPQVYQQQQQATKLPQGRFRYDFINRMPWFHKRGNGR